MVLLGTIVNAAAIIAGSLIGIGVPKLSEGIRTTVIQGLGLAILILGVSMAVKTTSFPYLVLSLVAGGIAGEALGIENGIERLGRFIEVKVVGKKAENERGGRIAKGFVTTTLIYCVGAMAILGSIDSGLKHQHDVLFTKAMLDGFLSIVFASTLGIGVLFSCVPVFLYQGAIAVAASWIGASLNEAMLNDIVAQISGVGGVLLMGIGINILEIKKVNVANLLPSLGIAAIIAVIVH